VSSRARRRKVAIIGGGCAGMAAAFELSRPERGYDVTVFQQGWRLGGKGASGRGPSGRIEEHGLHVWMGYYENAFRLMRECYEELGRARSSPLATWEDAFTPSGDVAAADRTSSGAWSPWTVCFPETAGRPGEPVTHHEPPGVPDYLVRTAALVGKLLATTFRVEQPGLPPASGLGDIAGRLAGYAGLGGLAAVLEALRAVELVIGQPRGREAPDQIIRPLQAISGATRGLLEDYVRERDELRRLWGVIDVALASMRGLADPKLLRENRGFDPLDRLDCRDWLIKHGASDDSIQSSFVRALYDLGFAYEDGDFKRPRIAAGAAMRGSLRAFFTYRGSFFWKMQAGMGDVVFAPLYEVLKRRGVRFDFFHRLRALRMESGGAAAQPFVAGLDFDVQARLRQGHEYAPLVDVAGLPCWPSSPDWAQLEDGARLRAEGHDFESHWDDRRAGARSLELGRDFDYVVLAVGVGALPHVAKQLVARDERWRTMIDAVKTVPTRAFQLWLKPSMEDLGWTKGPVSLTGFREPFDTWADMTHLVKAEAWRKRPGAIAYFCSVLSDPGPIARTDPEAQAAGVRRDAISFLNDEIGHLWPEAWRRPGEFRWELLHGADPDRASGAPRDERRFDGQFWRANVNPTDRYTLSLPGSIEHRISPLDTPVENMTVAGDWTECGLNLGCVEAAVMSGLLASHAISQAPSLSSIVGYRHP
jgi:uncharacterized protein with NAD-binding domain and iron-sulfur cluster